MFGINVDPGIFGFMFVELSDVEDDGDGAEMAMATVLKKNEAENAPIMRKSCDIFTS